MATSSHKEDLRLGEILFKKGVVTSDQIEIALTEQKATRQHLGKTLVSLGFATEAVIRDVLGGAIGQKSVDLSRAVAESDTVAMIPEDMARRLRVVPLHYDNQHDTLTVAMANVFDVVALDQLNAQVGGATEIIPALAGEAEVEKAIDQFYGFELSVDGILHEIETGEIDYQSLDTEIEKYSQPVVRLVNALLLDAVKRRASDIHFEPAEGFLRFRYRMDGVLRQIRSLHKDYWSAIAVRLKVMAGLDIAEARTPQDGRISLSLSGRKVDFRVSTLPTVYGENIVLRVLDRQRGIVALDALGLQNEELTALKFMVAKPEGIILVTGPTGSGKTTTLYSILHSLDTEAVNIMTLEDPVEYPSNTIRQTSANEASRLDFASGIRSLLRQDPDIILIGEIRDEDTATMALRAAMTGHQVYATLHTNSALAAIPRLLDIGVKPDVFVGNVIGVMAQRLVRVLCRRCKEKVATGELERNLLGLKVADKQHITHQAKGCAFCDKQGYKGRIPLIEILSFDHDMDELVSQQGTRRELLHMALSKGFRPLAEVGTDRVLDGTTSLDEISRVIDLTSRLQ